MRHGGNSKEAVAEREKSFCATLSEHEWKDVTTIALDASCSAVYARQKLMSLKEKGHVESRIMGSAGKLYYRAVPGRILESAKMTTAPLAKQWGWYTYRRGHGLSQQSHAAR